ncbi:mediator of DNA damage checkpoint protein 1 isoform X2 [Phyllopteryx taeniolatus]|uniref:mediator of DNA damage checkpoint protein 1 isoform X2 n=1 Tax=Phyllopteryx taeniolatus TaxID=161469 RepID=UPI002AD1F287|nr:mediator of DNA damage checkpoint protein 1 isoform X2 [Phyllopteryx taeniolatus]
MDATQVINDSILETDEEENEEVKTHKGRQPLAKLCILKNDHVPEREFPLFMGDNVLGRDIGTCTLPLPAPCVSKQHATICISVHRRRGSRSGVDMEALVWDLGSMNGTRKGRLKLTPNVRYALSEGDRLVMADIPCQYVSISEDVGGGTSDVRSSFPGDSVEESDSIKVSASKVSQASATVSCLGEEEKEPAPNSCVSFEATSVQLHGTVVPDSESDSDGEGPRHRESRCKLLGSDSDSHKATPTCSTFLSPTNKIVPESPYCVDESPITPSSSTREKPHGHVSFSKKEPDVVVGGQHKKNTLEIVDDSDEDEAGAVEKGQTPGRATLEEREHSVLEQLKSKASFTEEELSQLSTSTVSTLAIPKFNMDSDTDMEEDGGKAELVPDRRANAACFHMDSDTDVDEEGDTSAPPVHPDGPVSHMSADAKKADAAPPVLPDDFQLDSNTDVDAEAGGTTWDETPSRLDLIGEISKSDDNQASVFNTHVNVSDSATISNDSNAVRDPPHLSPVATTPSSVTPGITAAAVQSDSDADTDVDESSAPPADGDSDTDVEEEKNPIILPGIKPSCLQAPNLQHCSTPVQLSDGFNSAVRSAALSSCSDSQEEEEDFIVAETQSFILQTRGQVQSGLHDARRASGRESSSEDMEELPSGGASLQLGLSDSSHLESAGQALAMESTQAFVSVTEADTQAYANISSADPESLGNDLNMEATQANEVPARSPVLLEVQQVNLALQETQPYILEPYSESEEDPGEDTETQPFDLPTSSTLALAETQLMTAIHEEERPTTNSPVTHFQPNQIAKETDLGSYSLADNCQLTSIAATQPMATSESEKCYEDSIPVLGNGKVQLNEENQPNVNSYDLAANHQPLSIAVTKPTAASKNEETDAKNLIEVTCESKVQLNKEKQPDISAYALAVTTQPMAISEHEESAGEDLIPVLHEVKVQINNKTLPNTSSYSLAVATQPMSIAATQPLATSENEASDDEDLIPVFCERKVQLDKETQPNTSSYSLATNHQSMSIAPTQPLAASENEETDVEDLIEVLHASKVQLDKEMQPNVSSNVLAITPQAVSIVVTQPIATSENEESDDEDDSIPLVRNKRKARPLQINEESQSLSSTLEIPKEGFNGKSLSKYRAEGQGSSNESPLVTSIQPDEEETQPNLDTLPNDDKDESGPAQEKTETQTLVNFEVSSAATQLMDTCEDEEADSEILVPGLRKRKAKPLQIEDETQSLVCSQVDETETSAVEQKPMSSSEPGPQALHSQSKVRTSTTKHSRGTPSLLREKEEPIEKRQAIGNKARGMTRKCWPAGSKSEDEAMRQQTNLFEVQNREQERRRNEIAQKERKEREETEGAEEQKGCERLETEAKDRQKRDQAEKERQQNKEEKPRATQRGQRVARRTIAVIPAPDQDDVPAKRTRSRSNSSNSVSSEVSASSTQGSQGRGQGMKRSNGPNQAPITRRRTVAAGLTEQSEQGSCRASPPGALLRSSSPNALASEMSCSSSLVSQRGRGGRRGGGRAKTEPGPNFIPPILSQNLAPKPTPQGKRARKPELLTTKVFDEAEEEKPESKQAAATRGRRRANIKEPSNNSAAESPLPKRNIRARLQRTVKSETSEALIAPPGSDEGEAKDKRKGRKRVLEAKVKDENPAPVQAKRRASASCLQRGRNAKESPPATAIEDGSAASGGPGKSAQPQMPISSKRKTRDASIDSSPMTSCNSYASPLLSRRSRDASHSYKVLFTGVVDDAGERVLARLGGALANGVADMNCLVTDKVRRTVKFLCAVAKGIPIVNTHWLDKSGKAGSFLSPDAYIVKDPAQEKKFNFRLQESLRLASSQPLLQGYAIHITKSVKPEPVYMKDIISCSGATFLPKMPSSCKPHTMVISCTEDWPLCLAAVSASLPVVSAEFILAGILQHKLDFETHKLSGPLRHLQPAGGRRPGRKKT